MEKAQVSQEKVHELHTDKGTLFVHGTIAPPPQIHQVSFGSSTSKGLFLEKEVLPGKEGTCAVCAAPARSSCSACLLIQYCSPEHQKQDWSAHKKNCKKFVVATNKVFGRHLVAARNLKAGTLIIQEPSIMCSPRGLTDDYKTPICLSCCNVIRKANSIFDIRCSKCNWPVCSWTCEQMAFHDKNECSILAANRIPFPPTGDYPIQITYKMIEILRGVLIKERDPELWAKILDLQHTTDLGKETELFNDLQKLRKTLGVEDIGTKEDWERVLGILNVNNFAIEGSRGAEHPSFTAYIFLKASMLSHSCAPNCWWGVTMFPSPIVQIRTTVDVNKGEPLTVSYSCIYNSYGTHKRQELIMNDGEFICKCLRCLDPTELGSYVSALMCTKGCKTGYVLPTNPIDQESEWKCESCSKLYPWEEVREIHDDLMAKLEDCEALETVQEFINQNLAITVHPNHWLITEGEEIICHQRSMSLYDKNRTIESRDKYIDLCAHLLKIKNLISPGFSSERARALNYYARARLEKLQVVVNDKILTDKEEILAEADFVYLLYNEALSFYKNDVTETLLGEVCSLRCKLIMSDMKFVQETFSKAPENVPS